MAVFPVSEKYMLEYSISRNKCKVNTLRPQYGNSHCDYYLEDKIGPVSRLTV